MAPAMKELVKRRDWVQWHVKSLSTSCTATQTDNMGSAIYKAPKSCPVQRICQNGAALARDVLSNQGSAANERENEKREVMREMREK